MGENFDYRRDYFNKHKGFLNLGIYQCSYCGKILFGKSKVEVDHIIPKSKNQNLFNRSYNTVASCQKCNRKKSDKINARYLAQGYASKTLGTVGTLGGAAVGTAVGGSYKAAKGAVKGAGYVAGTTIKYGSKGLFWTLRQIFKGVWLVASTILSNIFKFIFKRWIVAIIIILILYRKYIM